MSGEVIPIRRLPVVTEERPRTRADCVDGPRPCPWGCRYNLLVEVDRVGGLSSPLLDERLRAKATPKDAARWIEKLTDVIAELPEGHPSCALDVADQGGITLDAVARLFGFTRERIRQIEGKAIGRLQRRPSRELRAYADHVSPGAVHHLADIDHEVG